MKFWASTGVTLLMALIIGIGMVRMSHGKGAGLFFLSLLGFAVLFSYFCLPPKTNHH
ncbi:MAG: hypothetical protein K0Q55_1580 [Verrucomicrobia bacterium]|jgi:hypothetical protein|nr:hypothetical protein [Verrucomicrobiota bacterium]